MSHLTLRVSAVALFGWLSVFTLSTSVQAQTYLVPTQAGPTHVPMHVAPPPPVVVLSAPPPQPVHVVTPVPVLLTEDTEPMHSVLRYSLQGFLAGGLVGAATGHLILHDAYQDERWRGYLMATGIGAIAGAGTGLVLGFFDSARFDRPTRYVMRDAAYGTLLGGLLGASIGGLVALNSHQGEDALLGASIGAVSGFGLGAIIGVLEGQRKPRAQRVQAGVTSLRDVRGKQALGMQLSGSF